MPSLSLDPIEGEPVAGLPGARTREEFEAQDLRLPDLATPANDPGPVAAQPTARFDGFSVTQPLDVSQTGDADEEAPDPGLRVCLKCGHRDRVLPDPWAGCLRCGAIYAKVDIVHAHEGALDAQTAARIRYRGTEAPADDGDAAPGALGVGALIVFVAALACSWWAWTSFQPADRATAQPRAEDQAASIESRTVILDTSADNVLGWRGQPLSTRDVGKDAQGLLVEWRYPDASYLMGRRMRAGIEAYRVVKITLDTSP